jgi:hypothetical protein
MNIYFSRVNRMSLILTFVKIFTILVLISNNAILTNTQQNRQILELNDTNFDEFRLKHEYVLIYFHATYSEESRFLQTHFRRLPDYIQSDHDISFAIITHKNYNVNHKYNIDFPYPKIILVNKENFYTYKGEMSSSAIGNWVTM